MEFVVFGCVIIAFMVCITFLVIQLDSENISRHRKTILHLTNQINHLKGEIIHLRAINKKELVTEMLATINDYEALKRITRMKEKALTSKKEATKRKLKYYSVKK